MKPLFSIIVPVYNVQSYLGICIESILKQSYSDFELLLIDDGSSDNSGKICDEYAQEDTRIKIVHRKNGGVSAARNEGLTIAQGKWIVFVDSDDWVDEELLQSYIPYIDDFDIVFQGFITENSTANISQCHKIEDRKFGNMQIADAVLYLERVQMIGWMCNKAYKRELIENNNIRFNENISIGEDHIFTLEYCQFVSSLACFCGTYYHYRILKNSLIRCYIPYQLLSFKTTLLYEHRLAIAEKFYSKELEQYAEESYYNSKIGNIQVAYQGTEKLRRTERYQLLKDSLLYYKKVHLRPFTLDWIISKLLPVKIFSLIDFVILGFVLLKKIR